LPLKGTLVGPQSGQLAEQLSLSKVANGMFKEPQWKK
jgi:hypothetical protein